MSRLPLTIRSVRPLKTRNMGWPRIVILCFLVSLLTACTGSSGPDNSSSAVNTPQAYNGNVEQTPPGPAIQCSSHSKDPVMLNMVYGSEKEAWIKDVVADFNNRHIGACDGPITVSATPSGSGTSMQDIIDGKTQPDIWSPAGGVWLNLLNSGWQQKHSGSTLIDTGATSTPSLVSSPVVIAMWKPQAEALGWPNKAISWADIANLSTNPKGWAAYGHPEFGQFKFGHTHPDYSNSGLDSVIAMNYAAAGKVRGLTTDDIATGKNRDFVTNVESSIIHYGESTGFFADAMFNKGPSYLSAAVMYENLVIEANSGQQYHNLTYPVVAIYPKEGTFYSDHPFATLQGSWVTPQKRAAAQALRNFLLAQDQQKKAMRYGFRPSDATIQITSPIDSSKGVDPTQPKTLLQVPSAEVINSIKANWNQSRRKVDVMLVLDRSGSMNDQLDNASKIEAAKQGLSQFVGLLGNDDNLGLTVFSTNADVIQPLGPLGTNRASLQSSIQGINADGDTRLYDTIAEQYAALQSRPSKNIKALVVLTDGQSNQGSISSADQLVPKVTSSGENAGNGVKVFAIAYGQDADATGLAKIAKASGGQEYSGSPQNIRQVYIQISEFF